MFRVDSIHITDLSYFCESQLIKGALVEFKTDSSVTKYRGGEIAGISLNDVVDIDLMKRHLNFGRGEVQQFSRIEMLTKGVIVYKFNKRLRLPRKQRIYCNPKTSLLDFRKYGPKIGYLETNQDKDGFCKIVVDFTQL